jgi:predicted Zn-dependent protease
MKIKAGSFFRIIALPVLLSSFLMGYFFLGTLQALTIEEERNLGDQVLREVSAKFTLIQDPVLLGFLNRLGQETLKQAGPQPYPFRFYLLKDSQLNAFSVPGGHIFLTTGIIEIMDSEAELAGLLGHEIAHVTNHHISRRMELEKKINLATMAIALASVFAGDPRIASAAITGSLAAGISMSLKYSREDEDEADNFGFKYMAREGFDPKGMVDLLDKIRRWGSYGSETIPAYLQTHPITGDRMSQIDQLRHRYLDQGPWLRTSSEDFRRFQVIILAKYGDIQKARNRFQVWEKDSSSNPWFYFGLGWLYLREGKFDSAIEAFEKTLAQRPRDPYFLRDLGQAYFSKGQYDLAIQKLGQAALINPQEGSIAFLLARAYQEKGEAQLALDNFNRVFQLNPHDGETHYYLGIAYGNLKDLGQAHFHFGKSFQIKGDTEKALFHFRLALKYSEQDERKKELLEREIKSLTGKIEKAPPGKGPN